MRIKDNGFQVQDSIANNHIGVNLQESNVNSGLNIQRNTIEIPTIRDYSTDSARLVKPKRIIRPIIKTIPQVPETDSIEHPHYNIAENNFIIHSELSFFDELYFTPYDPSLKTQKNNTSRDIINSKPTKQDKSITQIIAIDDTVVSYSKIKTTTGFGSTDWMLGVIIFALIVFSWIRVRYSKFFQTAIKASYNYFTARRINDEVNVTRNRVFYFMNLLFYITISLFIAQYLEYQHIAIFKLEGILLFFFIFVAIIILYFAKSILYNILDFLFLGKKSFTSYLFTVFLYNKILALVLLPIVSVLPYIPDNVTPWLFRLGIFVVLIFYILRIFRGLQISFKNRLSIFYLILYLCALEILPTLILFKFVLSYL